MSISKIGEVSIHNDVCALCRLTGTHLACGRDSGTRAPAFTRTHASKEAIAAGRSGLPIVKK